MTDIIEDIFAFLYTSSGKKNQVSNDSSTTCPLCGSEMEYDDERNEMHCPDCED